MQFTFKGFLVLLLALLSVSSVYFILVKDSVVRVALQILLGSVGLSLLSCSWPQVQTPKPDQIVNEQNREDCDAACSNLVRLRCNFAPEDCTSFCSDIMSEPFGVFSFKCVANSTTCQQAGGCE
jgi:hypothetical protein